MSGSLFADLILERREQANESAVLGSIIMTPPVSEDYWSYRVRLTDEQAIVAFPKFFSVGIGFAVEDDWNTNLPASCDAEQIFDHIAHNKGDDSIPDERVIEAIRLVQAAVAEDS